MLAGEVSPEPEPVQFLPRTEASRNETRAIDGCVLSERRGARVSDRSYVHTRVLAWQELSKRGRRNACHKPRLRYVRGGLPASRASTSLED